MKKIEVVLYNWKKIKNEYRTEYRSQKGLSPFISPQFIENTLKHKIFFSKSRFKKFIVAKGMCENGVLYAPLFIGSEISLVGDYTSASYTDVLCSTGILNTDLKMFIHELTSIFNKDFVFEKIMPSSSIYNCLDLIPSTPCVKIEFNNSFENYFKSLKKNVRQNYRTAFNRIKRENKEIYVRYFINQKIPYSLKKKILSLYTKRSAEWDAKNKSLLNKVHRRHFDLMNNSLRSIENNFCSVLYINNKICGFMMGVLTNDLQRCVVPRLAIDSEYGVYCPGLLLIIESIKKLIEINCKTLDLSRGDEKYKFTVGGELYYLLSGTIKNKNN